MKATHGAFLLANLFYLAVVHARVWTLGPTPADQALFSNADALPVPAARAVVLMRQLFGDFEAGYLFLNLLLLYAILVVAYALINATVRGPIWLGSFGIAILMANPMKNDAVLMLTGIQHLLPALLALFSLLAFHCAIVLKRKTVWYALSLLSFLLVAPFFPAYAGLFCAYPLLLLTLPGDSARPWWRVLPYAGIGLPLAIAGLLRSGIPAAVLDQFFTPLFLLVYPIGLLPETVARFHESPIHYAAALGMGIAITIIIGFKLRQSAFWLGIALAATFRLFSVGYSVDPISGEGGGVLIVPLLGASIALAALAKGMMGHPKWVRPVVGLTTTLCILYFALEWRSIAQWNDTAAPVANSPARPG
ncbi:MAG: hypothetical protein HYV27_23965 [Candidatus Hydrogenedentes bacterium]|nr:hypothetical protein [Candidatus Hydrogenedentota bacterium]